MKIAFLFQHSINPLKGGTERVTATIADFLINNGCDVLFISASDPKNESEIPFHGRHRFLPDSSDFDSIRNQQWLKNLISEEKIDIIVNQGAFTDECKLCAKSKLGSNVGIISAVHFDVISWIKYYHRFIPLRFNLLHPITFSKSLLKAAKGMKNRDKIKRNREILINYLSKESDYILFLSEKNFKVLNIKCLKPSQLKAIPNPNTYDTYVHFEKKKTVVYVGRLEYAQKRVDRLLQVWSVVSKNHSDWILKIIGDGTDRRRLEHIVRRKRIKNVEFHGRCNPKPFFEEAAIVCLTSNDEGFGMVLTEGMQHGAVPMAFNSYVAASDIIEDTISGFLVKPFNVKEYTRKLDLLMSSDDLRKAMSDAAIEKSKCFDIKIIGERWLEMLTELNLK